MNLKILQTCDYNPIYKEQLEVTSSTNKLYADRFGHTYEMFIGEKFPNTPRTGLWNRLQHFYDNCLDESVDWLLFLDTDAIIYEHSYDFCREIILEYSEYMILTEQYLDDDIFTDEDFNGKANFNGGSIFYNCNHRFSEEYFGKVLTSFVSNLDNPAGISLPVMKGRPTEYYMMTEISKLYYKYKVPFVKCFPHNTINFDGNYIKHFLYFDNRLQSCIDIRNYILEKYYN